MRDDTSGSSEARPTPPTRPPHTSPPAARRAGRDDAGAVRITVSSVQPLASTPATGAAPEVSSRQAGPAQPKRLRDALETAILTGEFAPGEKLEEVALARRFGVSRTPVRQALHQLATAGLVDSQPRRGAVVASLGPDRLAEMFAVMAELEAMAARLASGRLDRSDEGRLLDALAGCARAATESPDAYYYENERFHFALYDASGNVFLADQARALHRRLKPYRRMQLQVPNRVPTSLAEHAAIVAALRAGEPERAASLARDHVAVQGQRFADLVASLQGQQDGQDDRRETRTGAPA